eukprot:scaffold229150_cov17-Prasinocladus_malaysianus.AAC.1
MTEPTTQRAGTPDHTTDLVPTDSVEPQQTDSGPVPEGLQPNRSDTLDDAETYAEGERQNAQQEAPD